MALPTKGRVIIDTTVGEIDIELWSKVFPLPTVFCFNLNLWMLGNAQSLSQLSRSGYGGFVSFDPIIRRTLSNPLIQDTMMVWYFIGIDNRHCDPISCSYIQRQSCAWLSCADGRQNGDWSWWGIILWRYVSFRLKPIDDDLNHLCRRTLRRWDSPQIAICTSWHSWNGK